MKKLNSKLFDRIRIKPRHNAEPEVEAPRCTWEGCDRPGVYRAPKGHRAEGQYHNFCLEHVRQYNRSFDFFAGLEDEEIENHVRRSATTGDRPTRPAASNPAGRSGPRPRTRGQTRDFSGKRFSDPLHVFARYARAQARNPIQERERHLLEADRRALETLGLESQAKGDDVKKAYKALVKIHHPDANGGDRASEDRLRTIIAAYTHLKNKGFV